MSRQYEKVKACYEYCRTVTDFQPRVGLILGSGLGNYARNMKVECEIPYGDIPDFPVSTVAGHDGRFLFGMIGDVPAVVMKGRVHFYEGYTPQEVVLPIRVMKLLGIEVLFLTNASGGINRNFQVGDFMMITDQISNFVPSPLIGENVRSSTSNPVSTAYLNTASITSIWVLFSRTTPFLPTFSRPASNWGLIRAATSPLSLR